MMGAMVSLIESAAGVVAGCVSAAWAVAKLALMGVLNACGFNPWQIKW